jgi:hypothetical protein
VARVRADAYELSFPRPRFRRVAVPPGLAEALGAAPAEVWEAPYLIALFDDPDVIPKLRPRLSEVLRISTEHGGQGNVGVAAVAAVGQDHDVIDRFFAPGYGFREDPATGSFHAILTPIPSCTLMVKQELPMMFPDDADVALVRDAMFDPFEYLMARRRDGLLKEDYKQPLGKVAYQVPCHSRVQKGAMKTGEALSQVPGTEVLTIERCSGHAGTWGVKEEFHDIALKIGRPVVRQIAEFQPDYFSSDCQLGGHHIEEGLERADGKGKAQLRHPLTLLRMAYGLPD